MLLSARGETLLQSTANSPFNPFKNFSPNMLIPEQKILPRLVKLKKEEVDKQINASCPVFAELLETFVPFAKYVIFGFFFFYLW